ncbi:MAG: hypothetical protein ACYC6Z_05645 [Thermoleophilia bacterium]
MVSSYYSDIKRKLNEKSTEELFSILIKNDKDEWTEDAFRAIRSILEERTVEESVKKYADEINIRTRKTLQGRRNKFCQKGVSSAQITHTAQRYKKDIDVSPEGAKRPHDPTAADGSVSIANWNLRIVIIGMIVAFIVEIQRDRFSEMNLGRYLFKYKYDVHELNVLAINVAFDVAVIFAMFKFIQLTVKVALKKPSVRAKVSRFPPLVKETWLRIHPLGKDDEGEI